LKLKPQHRRPHHLPTFLYPFSPISPHFPPFSSFIMSLKGADESITIGELLASGALNELLPSGDSEIGFAVVPKEDCPHIRASETLFCDESHAAEVAFSATPCVDCGDSSECWLCLHCRKLHCSRYVKGHAAKHANANAEHCVAVSLSDMSVWCFPCDSYITHPPLKPLLAALSAAKFAPPPNGDAEVDGLQDRLATLSVAGDAKEDMETKPKPERPLVDALDELSLVAVAKAIRTGKCKNIIVMSGAGISVAAGIPDFRSPGTGLYANLQKYNLPYPTAVFEIDYFKEKPEPFCLLARELYPGNYAPTPAHCFVRLLHEKGVLLRNYTQNIDTLEREAGVPGEKLVEAHGSFAQAHCLECKRTHSREQVKEEIFAKRVPRCTADGCDGLVKPDIVFFGESLPERFHQLSLIDFPKCDLLIVMGTSLRVQPFAGLIHRVPADVPRLLLNMEVAGECDPVFASLGLPLRGFLFDMKENRRDVCVLGDVQSSCATLAELIGWKVGPALCHS